MKYKNYINKFFLVFASIFMLVSCTEENAELETLNYVSFEKATYGLGVALDATLTKDVYVYSSSVMDYDRVYEVVVDPTSTMDAAYYSVPTAVTVPAGSNVGAIPVTVTGTGLGNGKTIKLNLTAKKDFYVGGQMVINVTEACFFNSVTLSIIFDNYPEESAWELYDSSLNVVASGGITTGGVITGYAALGFADASTFTTKFCLPAGSYQFVMYDDYGDGMYTSASVQGSYSLKLTDGTVIGSGGGNFGSSQISAFTLQ